MVRVTRPLLRSLVSARYNSPLGKCRNTVLEMLSELGISWRLLDDK